MKTAHQAQDIAAIDTAMEELNTVFQAASQEMYAAQQEAQAGAGEDSEAKATTAETSSDEEVTDVDFEEVKDSEGN